MRIEMIIRLESGETYLIDRMDEVYALIGGWTLPEESQKPFRRVRGNNFTLDDLDAISALVDAAAAETCEKVFLDPKVQAYHEAAQAASRRQARAIFDDFMHWLHLEMQESQ